MRAALSTFIEARHELLIDYLRRSRGSDTVKRTGEPGP